MHYHQHHLGNRRVRRGESSPLDSFEVAESSALLRRGEITFVLKIPLIANLKNV
jgi:hypothetical protein